MSNIKVMDELLSNKIAAGEVVEKIVSIVKELTENSIDAKSSEIKIELIESGLREIKVVDNGKEKKELVGPREQVIVAGAFPLYMAGFVWRLHRDRFCYQLAINQLAFIISRIDFYFASGFKL